MINLHNYSKAPKRRHALLRIRSAAKPSTIEKKNSSPAATPDYIHHAFDPKQCS